jgi:NTP pyrophosphatase (non-canonical NTP hydrolase)
MEDRASTMTIAELIAETMRLRERFKAFEAPPWNIETMVTELLAEMGTLADSVMISEGHRKVRPGDSVDLADDIADILFMIICIAQHYGVDVEKAYRGMLDTTHRKLMAREQERRKT